MRGAIFYSSIGSFYGSNQPQITQANDKSQHLQSTIDNPTSSHSAEPTGEKNIGMYSHVNITISVCLCYFVFPIGVNNHKTFI